MGEDTDAAAAALEKTFTDYGLDARLLKAVKALNYSEPTPVQAVCIPLALRGKDILARAKTGSGKTAAYAIPIVQRIIREKAKDPQPHVRALVIVPTAELCAQVQYVFRSLLAHLPGFSVTAAVSTKQLAERVPLQAVLPDILVATPKCIHEQFQINAKKKSQTSIDFSHVSSFVIDEADLVMQQVKELDALRVQLPVQCQTYMVSATLSDDLAKLKTAILNSPFVVKVGEEVVGGQQIRQYHATVRPDERYLATYGLMRLGYLSGKILIFTNSTDSSYRLKMFLEAFGYASAVLSSEVPQNSRLHAVQQFNSGKLRVLIATDESISLADEDAKTQEAADPPAAAAEEPAAEEPEAEQEEEGERPRKRKRRLKAEKARKAKSAEYGVQRGVDFAHVAWVVNFDPPEDAANYLHRIGRTGRAKAMGSALTFFACGVDLHEELLAGLVKDQQDQGLTLTEYSLPWTELNRLSYRVSDKLQQLTCSAIGKYRQKELATEILNSDKLQAHFEENPKDLAELRHISNEGRKVAKANAYLVNLPDYLQLKPLPTAAKPNVKQEPKPKRQKLSSNQQLDPLKTFKYTKSKALEKHLTHAQAAPQSAAQWDVMNPRSSAAGPSNWAK